MLNEFVLLLLLVVVASVLSIAVEWHVALACLWLVYVIAGTWLLVVATPELALAKFVTGTTVCALLLPGLRALSSDRAARGGRVRRLVAATASSGADEPFMLVGAVLVAAAAVSLSYAFPIVEGASNVAWYWLGLLGVLLVMLSRDLVRTGIGLMLLLNAVDLLDTMVARNQGVGAIGARSVVTIVLALTLASVWSALQARAGGDRSNVRSPTVSLEALLPDWRDQSTDLSSTLESSPRALPTWISDRSNSGESPLRYASPPPPNETSSYGGASYRITKEERGDAEP